MDRRTRPGTTAITITVLVALTLAIVPLPDWARLLRPNLVAMVLIYWCMATPEQIGVGTAFATGLLMDTLTGTLLGQHALGLSIIAYLTLSLYQRIRLFPLWQQSLFVLGLLALNQALNLWVNGIIGRPNHTWEYWLPSVIGMFLWPVVFKLLRGVRRQFQNG